MTDTGMELALPHSGELISLEDPVQVASALEEIRRIEQRLADVKRLFTEALIAESTRVGGKTMRLGELKVVVKDSSSVLWDIEQLEKLLKAGLPEERYNELVTTEISFKVNAAVAKQIAGSNPKYARIIRKARTDVPKTPYVTVTPL